MTPPQIRLFAEVIEQGTLSLTQSIMKAEFGWSMEQFRNEVMARLADGYFGFYAYGPENTFVDLLPQDVEWTHQGLRNVQFRPLPSAFAHYEALVAEGRADG